MLAPLALLLSLLLAPATQPVVVPGAEQFDLTTPAGETYRVFVAKPAGEAKSYGAMIVLDANAMFFTAVEASRFGQGFTPHLIVGVGYPIDGPLDQQRRYYDFTPNTPPEVIRQSGSSARMIPNRTGGEDAFLDFLETQLKPELEARYPIDRANYAIFGHSLAGRFVLHALFTRPGTFKTYAAASPSIWWNEKSILREIPTFESIRRTNLTPLRLQITVAEYDQRVGPGATTQRAEFLAFAQMVDAARSLSMRLLRSSVVQVDVTFAELKDENHGSVVPPSIARALALAFRATPTTRPS